MGNRENIASFLRAQAESFCDDCLSEVLSIGSRQQVNQIARALAAHREIRRVEGVCGRCGRSKLVNGPPGSRAAAEAVPSGAEVRTKGAVKEKMPATEIRARLEEQLSGVEELIARGAAATLDEMKDWTYWTVTVIERAFGENSKKVSEFRGVSGGVWPFDGESAEAKGYRQRLPEWRRLLRTRLREIDEFEMPSETAEQYIPPRSQLDAYARLKKAVEQAVARLVVVDAYVDESTLQALLGVNAGVEIRVLTVRPAKDFAHVVDRFRQQWGGNIEARKGGKELHDRFLVVDDRVFLSGASFKDLGRRGSTLIELHNEAAKADIRRDVEKSWQAAEGI